MSSLIALLGAVHSGRHALQRALALRLQGTAFCTQVIEDEAAWAALDEPPALVLLLAPRDAAAGEAAGEAQDLRWRGRLAQAGIGFSVLHGNAQAQLDGAWHLVQPLLGLKPAQQPSGQLKNKRWTWSCDKCSDPTCEHQLFQDLIRSRQTSNGDGY